MSFRKITLLGALLCTTSAGAARADTPDEAAPAAAPSAPEPPARDWEIALGLGYAFPVGAAEAGSHVGDSTLGAAPVSLRIGRRVSSRFQLQLGLAWGPTLPTLCATASECFGSFGADLQLTVGARARLLESGPWSMHAAAAAGWEWLSTSLEDEDASSTRRYHGPVLLAAELSGERALGSRWHLGPALGGGLGTFVHASLEAPGIDRGGSIDGVAVHGWVTLSLRLSAAL